MDQHVLHSQIDVLINFNGKTICVCLLLKIAQQDLILMVIFVSHTKHVKLI
jgi:hypothetical protein